MAARLMRGVLWGAVAAATVGVSLALTGQVGDASGSANTISPLLTGASHSSMVLDASGNPVISAEGSGQLKIVHCNDTGCIGGDESITTPAAAADSSRTSIQLDASGFPVVSYQDAGSFDLRVLHCNDPHCAGGDESITAPDTAGDVGAYSSLQIDSAGNPVVSYYRWDDGSLRLLHCNDPACAGGDDSIQVIGTFATSSLALDALDRPVILYQDIDLKLMHCNDPYCAGGDEQIGTVDGGPVEHSAHSLILDFAGNPVMAYDKGGLTVARCNDAHCQGGDEVITNPANTAARDMSVALDADGNPLVAYYDPTFSAQDSFVLHCNDPYCAFGAEALAMPDSAGDVGSHAALALDSAGNPVVAYLAEPPATFGLRVRVLHCGSVTCLKPDDPSFGLDFSLGVDTDGNAGDDCQTKIAGPTTCAVVGSTFVVKVYLNSLPHGVAGYRGFTLRLDYLNQTSKQQPDAEAWSDCVTEDVSAPHPTHAEWGCTANLDSGYTGVIGTAEFTCEDDGYVDLSPSITRLRDGQGEEYRDDGVSEVLTVHCADVVATPTPNPVAGVSFDTPPGSNAFEAWWLGAIAVAAFSALGAAAICAQRAR